jgi:hypothetical protein
MAERETAQIEEVREEEQSRFGTGGVEDLSPRGGPDRRREPEGDGPATAPSRGSRDWEGPEDGPAPGGYSGPEHGRGNYDTGAGSNVESVTFNPLDRPGEDEEDQP